MHIELIFMTASLLALSIRSLSLEDAAFYDDPRSNSPSEEVSYDNHVWPRSISQSLQGFLTHHFDYIDDSSGVDPTANDKNCAIFAALFTSDATSNVNGRISTGTAAIQETYLAIFKTIPYRKHLFTKAYSFDRDEHEVVVTGSVMYGLKIVDEKSREWTEIFSLVEVGGEMEIKSERVWADLEV